MADTGNLMIQCCTLCCLLLLVIVFSVAGITMMVYGAVCIHTDNYDSCGSLVGAILLVIFGILIVCCCCFSGGVSFKKKESIKDTIADF